MQGRPQAVDVRAGIGLSLTRVLLRRGIACCAHPQRILLLAGLEEAGDTEVNELDCAASVPHDVVGLQVAEDHRRLPIVEIG